LMKNIAAAAQVGNGTNYYTQYRYQALFGRINYDYKSRYIINLTGRRDGSSRFGPGRQFAFFKAVGAAWIFSNEAFVRNALPFLSYGKLKVSYGTTGNDQIGDYQFLDSYATSSEYNGVVGLSPDRLYNPNFAWEENRKFELGVELGAIDDRVLMSLSYYRNRSDNQLVGQPLAPTTGFASIQVNFPAVVENTGVEIELNSSNISNPVLTWTTTFNFTIPHNELISFPNIENYPEYERLYVVGEPLTIVKLYHYTGIDPVTGLHTVADVNGDGTFDFQDRQIPKLRGRRYFGGLQNRLTFRGFQLDLLFQYVNQQGYDYIQTTGLAPGTIANQPVAVLDRWQREGDKASFQRYTTTGSGLTAFGTLYAYSDAQVTDASFLRLKNLSLSYEFSDNVLKRVKVARIRLYVQAQNVVTFTQYKGLEPEFPGRPQLPALRTFTIGMLVGL
jgi:hypothetical protein